MSEAQTKDLCKMCQFGIFNGEMKRNARPSMQVLSTDTALTLSIRLKTTFHIQYQARIINAILPCLQEQ